MELVLGNGGGSQGSTREDQRSPVHTAAATAASDSRREEGMWRAFVKLL